MKLSTAQISAQLDRVLASDATLSAIAIRAPGRQDWPGQLNLRGRSFALRWCESSLAFRDALSELDALAPSNGLVVLTPLSDRALAEDLAARLARGRIFQPEGWDIVRQLFQAKDTDARLGRYAWMPQALIDGAAQGPYMPVPNGFLDLDTAWREVLGRFLGLASARPDGTSLLQWSMKQDADNSLNLFPTPARAEVVRWLAESGGPVGQMVLACVEAGRTMDALPLGIVCGVVFASDGEGQTALGTAAIRMERFVNGQRIGLAEGKAWARDAEFVLRTVDSLLCRVFLERADALLRDLDVAEYAHLSDWLPVALEQRLRDFALALGLQARDPTATHLDQVERHADRALRHSAAKVQAARLERVEMARRIARWCMRPAPPSSTFASAAIWQADEGAYLDWARFRLLGGDELPELSQAYGALRQVVTTRRNAFAASFANLLQPWTAKANEPGGRLVPLERVIEQVVATLPEAQPVLLLVMDGLSLSIYRELFAQVANLGWAEVVPADTSAPLVGVAALPTITEVSRASLLSGRVTTGAAAQEKASFASHAALLHRSQADLPPRLFHKGDLADSTHLAAEVRSALANAKQKVVGVVYNAVDDHLSGPQQLQQRWSLDELRLLLPLLHEARQARRLVIITADHGHLLEDDTRQVGTSTADRWRAGTSGAVSSNERVFKGARVRTPEGEDAVVCLCDESSRYTGRKNGYHGGASPQEVLVPLSVYVPTTMALPGWQPALPPEPEWWSLPSYAAQPTAPEPAAVRPAARKKAAPVEQAMLFDALPPVAPAEAAVSSRDWIGDLLSSGVYQSQRQLAARVALPDDKMRLLLQSLTDRGGKLTRSALAQRLAITESRISGVISAARRVLNVDQADVLTVDDSAGTVELNRTLLLQQFGLSGTGGAR
jgi:hypothetical protein